MNQGRSSRLTTQRLKKLEDVGFVWEAQRGRRKLGEEDSKLPASITTSTPQPSTRVSSAFNPEGETRPPSQEHPENQEYPGRGVSSQNTPEQLLADVLNLERLQALLAPQNQPPSQPQPFASLPRPSSTGRSSEVESVLPNLGARLSQPISTSVLREQNLLQKLTESINEQSQNVHHSPESTAQVQRLLQQLTTLIPSPADANRMLGTPQQNQMSSEILLALFNAQQEQMQRQAQQQHERNQQQQLQQLQLGLLLNLPGMSMTPSSANNSHLQLALAQALGDQTGNLSNFSRAAPPTSAASDLEGTLRALQQQMQVRETQSLQGHRSQQGSQLDNQRLMLQQLLQPSSTFDVLTSSLTQQVTRGGTNQIAARQQQQQLLLQQQHPFGETRLGVDAVDAAGGRKASSSSDDTATSPKVDSRKRSADGNKKSG